MTLEEIPETILIYWACRVVLSFDTTLSIDHSNGDERIPFFFTFKSWSIVLFEEGFGGCRVKMRLVGSFFFVAVAPAAAIVVEPIGTVNDGI